MALTTLAPAHLTFAFRNNVHDATRRLSAPVLRSHLNSTSLVQACTRLVRTIVQVVQGLYKACTIVQACTRLVRSYKSYKACTRLVRSYKSYKYKACTCTRLVRSYKLVHLYEYSYQLDFYELCTARTYVRTYSCTAV